MGQYCNNRDNRPDVVSSAHWNDYGACSTDDPRLKVMRNLSTPDNSTPVYPSQHKATPTYREYSLPAAIVRGNSQAYCNNITYQKTKF